MVGSKLVSNALVLSDDIAFDIHVAIFLLLSNISELSIGKKIKNSERNLPVRCILPNKKSYPFSDIY